MMEYRRLQTFVIGGLYGATHSGLSCIRRLLWVFVACWLPSIAHDITGKATASGRFYKRPCITG